MDFITSYKHLEKLCGEILNDDRRISAYIDEMQSIGSRGAFLVKGWDCDLKALKNYRWIRNQISHDPECTEENMCVPEDALWLDTFYSRIMKQEDPLSLYRKAIQAKTATRQAPKPTQKPISGSANPSSAVTQRTPGPGHSVYNVDNISAIPHLEKSAFKAATVSVPIQPAPITHNTQYAKPKRTPSAKAKKAKSFLSIFVLLFFILLTAFCIVAVILSIIG